MTDDYADFYVEIECGLYITKEEELAILRESEKYEDAIEIWTKNTKKDYKKFK